MWLVGDLAPLLSGWLHTLREDGGSGNLDLQSIDLWPSSLALIVGLGIARGRGSHGNV